MAPLPDKKTVATELLKRASVFVHLDPRRPGVIVPQGFLKQHQLVLQIGLNMAIAIPDLEVDDEGVRCTLSFNKRPHFCKLPWSSIYALIGEQGGGMVWPEDVPPEVVSQQQQSAAKKEALRQRKANLRAVDDSADRSSARSQPIRPEPIRPEPARSEPPRKEGVRRASSPPPKLVRVVSKPEVSKPAPQPVAPEPEPVPSPARLSEASSAPAESAPRPHQGAAGTKRQRPPYLRLVE